MKNIRYLLLSALLVSPLFAGAQSYVNLAGDTMLGALNITLNGNETTQTLLSLLGPIQSSGPAPMVILKKTTPGGREWRLRSGGSGPFTNSFDIYDATAGKSRLVIDEGGNVSIGTGVTAFNSRLFVYGGPTGANIDVRGDPQTDQAIIELEGNDYDKTPNSVSLRYFGNKHNFGTKIMGIPVQKMGVLEWVEASTALIYTANNIPIIFGTNSKERMRITENGGLAIGTTNAGSAKLSVSGSVVFHSLKNCDTLDTDANGNLLCGADASGSDGGSAFGSGNVITIGDSRYVNVTGDTVNGALVLNDALTLNTLKNCDTLDTDANGKLVCGMDAVGTSSVFGSGNVITIGDSRYVNVSGDAMTGLLDLRSASNAEILRFTNTTNSLTSGVYVGAADPNGTVQANKGSLFIDQSNGLAYVKTSANGANNGWSKISLFTDAILPSRATLWHDESTVVTGGAVSLNQDVNQLYSTYSFQSPASANDAFVNGFTLKAGTYKFSVLGMTNYAKGKIDWSIDGVPAVSGQDWYSVSGTYNVVKTATVTVTGNGYHVLKGKVNGKHPSSTAYNLLFTKMWLTPIAQ